VDPEVEDAAIRQLETSDTEGVVPLPGALELVRSIPRERWALVTSGTGDVAMARMKAGGVPEAGAYVFGNDVANGKPAPDPFLLAAKRLGFGPSECVGIEDTQAGVSSVHAAGMEAIGIRVPSADYAIDDLRAVRVEFTQGALRVRL
jgi:sugar-phosphatase